MHEFGAYAPNITGSAFLLELFFALTRSKKSGCDSDSIRVAVRIVLLFHIFFTKSLDTVISHVYNSMVVQRQQVVGSADAKHSCRG